MVDLYVDGLLLADLRLDRQAVFNAGKVAQKVCEQNKNLIACFGDILVGDATIVYKNVTGTKTPEEFKNTLTKLGVEIAKSNVADKDHYSQITLAGYDSARTLEEMAKHINNATETIADLQLNVKSKNLTKRRFNLKLSGPKSSQKIFKGVNKPKQNISNNAIFKRGGSLNSNELIKSIENNQNKLIINFENSNINKIFEKIYKYRLWIQSSFLIGSIILIVFKKPKFVRQFFNRIKKCVKSIFIIYKKISFYWIINNRFTKSCLVIHRAINFHGN